MGNQLEYIKHAAIKSTQGKIFIGKSHEDAINLAKHIGHVPSPIPEDQGFLTNLNNYLNRHQAAKLAYKAKQIDENLELLISEQLWSKQYNGKYIYSPVTGYIPNTDTGKQKAMSKPPKDKTNPFD